MAVPPAKYQWSPNPEFSDEFNADSLDTSKWRNYHPYWSGRNSTFKPENVSVGEGCLRLKSTLIKDANDVTASTVTAACVSSQRRGCLPGYYEARIKASNLSMTSAFWFQGKYSEIDVIENVGDASLSGSNWIEDTMMMNTHYYVGGWDNDIKTPMKWKMPTPARKEFHTYGVWWRDPNSVWFYHNDVKVAEVKTGGPFNEQQYMFFDTEVFTWHGWPTMNSLLDPSKNVMYVDWIRAWTREDKMQK